MRDGKIGLAPLAAVLSFLRQEGEPYTLVTSRAGEYAAQWTFDNLTPIERSFIRALPVMMRARMAMQLAKKVVRRSYDGSRAVAKLRRGQGTFTLRSSIFCTVREPFDWPLCVFYSAALSHLFALVGVSGEVRVHTCQGVGDAALRHRGERAAGAEIERMRFQFRFRVALVLVLGSRATVRSFAQPPAQSTERVPRHSVRKSRQEKRASTGWAKRRPFCWPTT